MSLLSPTALAAGSRTPRPAAAGTGAARAPLGLRDGGPKAAPQARRLAAAELRTRLGMFGEVALDEATGTPRMIARLDGFLTPTSDRGPGAVALTFVRDHSTLFGLSAAGIRSLRLARSWRASGYTHLVFAQTIGGIPVIDHGIVANVRNDGRLINIGGSPAPDLDRPGVAPRVTARRAVQAAMSRVGSDIAIGAARRRSTQRRETVFASGQSAALALFATGDRVRLVWRLTLRLPSGGYEVVVDARTADVLTTQSLTDEAVKAKVFPYFPGAPTGGSQVKVDITPYVTAPGQARFFGQFAYVFSDLNDDQVVQPSEEVPPSSGNNYLYTFQPFNVPTGNCTPYPCSWDYTAANSWQTNRKQAATQAFYFVNRFHDHLLAAPISFTPAKGNFEGNDRVWVNSYAGANTDGGFPSADDLNNSFMQVFPTGPPLMTLQLVEPDTEQRTSGDTSNDASLVFHEYTHGLSNRLIADADGVSLLIGHQSESMGEAWSDWYAMDYIVQQGLESDTSTPGQIRIARYLDRGTNIWRTQGLDCPVGAPAGRCPGSAGAGPGGYTYGDMGKVIDYPENHADGEIWAETLWDLRQRLIADHGASEGDRRAELLVTRAMELSPAAPSFLDMRNAIVQADTAFNGGQDGAAVWQVFAARGMGFFASTTDTSDVHPLEDFSPPPAGTATGTIAGNVTTQLGAPVAGADVRVGGHASGFPDDLRATTDAAGHYAIPSVPVGTYRQVIAVAPGGYDPGTVNDVAVPESGTVTADFALLRDWASSQGGASISAFTGPSYSGCQPKLAIDGTRREAWVTDSPADPNDPGPKSITVKLPSKVDITSFAIDPSNGCGEGITTSLGQFRIETSADGVSFSTSAKGTFTQADTYRLNSVSPTPGTASGVQYIRLTGIHTQNETPPFRGSVFMSITELEVYGTIAAAAPTITSFSPTSGPVGTRVHIIGTNFVGVTSVKFGTKNASFTVVSKKKITATVPAGAQTAKITVIASGGTAKSPQKFTVT